jgi:hypothetical protein
MSLTENKRKLETVQQLATVADGPGPAAHQAGDRVSS